MNTQEIKRNDIVELNNGKTGRVLSTTDTECTVQIKTIDGLFYERTLEKNHVKKV